MSFEFHEPTDVLLLTDGEDIDIYYYEEDCGRFVTVCDMGMERIHSGKQLYYIEKDILVRNI
jgi:hypothetical protein